MTNHTPGPWAITKAPATAFRGFDLISGSERVASTPGYDSEDPRYDREVANARLIAAAPDLLAALEALEVAALVSQARPQELAQARAAIAKAKGETQ